MTHNASDHIQNDRSRIWISLVLLTIFTVITFANSLHDRMVYDDNAFLGPDAQFPLENLSGAFFESVWGRDNLYRPLLKIDFELQTRLLGDWVVGYHLGNILLHLLITLVLFGWLRYLILTLVPGARNAEFWALLAALVFAVHPTHAEVINLVFNKSSMYVSLAAISGLWWLQANIQRSPARAWTGFGLIYCIAILFKESALVLPGLAVAMIVLFTEGRLIDRIRRFLPVFWLLIPIAIYFWIRSIALSSAGDDATGVSNDLVAMLGKTELAADKKLIRGIAIYGQGLKLMVWPWPLQLYHEYPNSVETIVFIGLQVVLIAWAIYLWAKGRPVLVFALVFYYLTLLPSLRLISMDGMNPHMSERYLYTPSVGLAVALAFGFRAAADRLGRKSLIFLSLPVMLLLAALSWHRNADWVSNVQLFEAEYSRAPDSTNLLNRLATAHFFFDRRERVTEICDEWRLVAIEDFDFLRFCVLAYIDQDRTDSAIAVLEDHAQHGDSWIKARLLLAEVYRAVDRYQQTVEQFAAIIDRVDDPAEKEMYKAEMLLMVYPDDDEQWRLARIVFQRALEMNPDLELPRERIREIDAKLAGPGVVSDKDSNLP